MELVYKYPPACQIMPYSFHNNAIKHFNNYKSYFNMKISVFKTSIQEKDLTQLPSLLDNLEDLTRWNTDLEDCDNILRVESNKDLAKKIITILSKQGINCEELEY